MTILLLSFAAMRPQTEFRVRSRLSWTTWDRRTRSFPSRDPSRGPHPTDKSSHWTTSPIRTDSNLRVITFHHKSLQRRHFCDANPVPQKFLLSSPYKSSRSKMCVNIVEEKKRRIKNKTLWLTYKEAHCWFWMSYHVFKRRRWIVEANWNK